MSVVATDPFATTTPRPPGPPERAFAVTPSDTDELPVVTRGIYVGGAGDLAVVMAGDVVANAVTLKAVPVGTYLPLAVRQVKNTNTTATLLIGMY